MQTPERHVPLAGASNFRDFGGYPTQAGGAVRWGPALAVGSVVGADGGGPRAAGAAGHPACVRPAAGQRGRGGADPLAGAGGAGAAASAAVPRRDRTPACSPASPRTRRRGTKRGCPRQIMAQLYARLVSEAGALAIYREMFRPPGQSRTPRRCCSTARPARTAPGVTCALILGALGVSREDVTADFMLTQRLLRADAARQARISQIIAEAGLGFWSEEVAGPDLHGRTGLPRHRARPGGGPPAGPRGS